MAEQLAKGGGILFKYISREAQAQMNVDTYRLSSITHSPSAFLESKRVEWAAKWSPEGHEQELAVLAENMRSGGMCCIQTHPTFSLMGIL